MVGFPKKYLPCYFIALFFFTSFVNAESLIDYKQGCEPRQTGERLVRNLLGREDYMLYSDTWFHYSEAAAAYDAYHFAGLTGDKELLADLNERYVGMIEEGKIFSRRPHVDQSVIAIVPLEIYMQTGNRKMLEIGLSFADAQWENPNADGLTSETRWWIDDTYMVGMLQMQAYRATGEAKYADRAALLVEAYLEKLQTPSGLFKHGPEYPFYWGRGNGWVASALAEVLKSLPQDHPKRKPIMAGYLRMMDTLLKHQADSGMWRQLIDYEDSWAESSSTAMFTYAMITGLKNGWLEGDEYRTAAQKGWNALCVHLDKDANLTEVCAGTGRNKDIEYYLNRPRISGDMHGQAPMLWCACELLDKDSTKKSNDKEGNTMEIKITSSAFEQGGMIPPKYTCDGDDISPPLKWDTVPDDTKSIALISDDPDAPMGTWVHWVMYNMPADKRELPENFPDDETLEDGTRQGVTDFGKTGYGGPCPPSGTHRYYFKIYALDTTIDEVKVLDKEALVEAMEGHILAEGELMGKYKRQ